LQTAPTDKYSAETADQKAVKAAGLAELESEQARRKRARKGGEVGGTVAGRGRPKLIGLATDVSAKSKPKSRTPRTIEKAARSAGVTEHKVKQHMSVKTPSNGNHAQDMHRT
jgi:hypothetical protein